MNFFKKLFGKKMKPSVIKGDIMLGFGKYEIEIKLNHATSKVSLNMHMPCDDDVPVCGGGVNKVGITIIEHGFILHADIKTNTCCLEWMCD